MNIPEENKKEWEKYRTAEFNDVADILLLLGFSADTEQTHTQGERYLMSGRKLVLTGHREHDGKKVIIKISSDPRGIKELEHEHLCRETIKKIDFAYKDILLPEEILFAKTGKFTVVVSAFIEEPVPFLLHSREEQFFLTLRAFEMLEGVHATASSHTKIIRSLWSSWGGAEYLRSFGEFSENIRKAVPRDTALHGAMAEAQKFLLAGSGTIERYSGFLTHGDFVPHNLRIVGHDVYLLDHTSLLFGNKYESAARFLNYLCVYHPELERWISEYIRKNRGEDEYLSLRLMRAYKMGFLLQFYTGSLAQTEGDLHRLAWERISFWKSVLSAILNDEFVPVETVLKYKNKRDSLRSEEEVRRQKKLHQI
ncbi:MAG: hypothetical protein WCT48_02005 [Candidatus Paceibacterota bacterium]